MIRALAIVAVLLLSLAPPARGGDDGAPPPAASAPAEPAPVLVHRITDEQLTEILRGEGYAPTFERPGVLRTRIEPLTVLFFVADDGRSLQAFTGFRSTTTSLETVNAWNRGHRYSRAYLDPDGDPVIELDLDLAGGVSRERLLDYLRTVRVSVLAFVKAVTGENPERP